MCPPLGICPPIKGHRNPGQLRPLPASECPALLRDAMAMGQRSHIHRRQGQPAQGPDGLHLGIWVHFTPWSLPAHQEKHCRLVPREEAPCPQDPGCCNFHQAAAFGTRPCLEWGPQALGVFQLNGEAFRGAEMAPHFMGEDTIKVGFLGTNLKIPFRPIT